MACKLKYSISRSENPLVVLPCVMGPSPVSQCRLQLKNSTFEVSPFITPQVFSPSCFPLDVRNPVRSLGKKSVEVVTLAQCQYVSSRVHGVGETTSVSGRSLTFPAYNSNKNGVSIHYDGSCSILLSSYENTYGYGIVAFPAILLSQRHSAVMNLVCLAQPCCTK